MKEKKGETLEIEDIRQEIEAARLKLKDLREANISSCKDIRAEAQERKREQLWDLLRRSC